MWTKFWDMHSGGGQKEEYHLIFIEAPEPEAKVIFYNRFGHNPDRVTCTCCGSDYSISEGKSLQELSAYHRNCAYGKKGYLEEQNPDYKNSPYHKYKTLEEFIASGEALVIYEKDIKPEERVGNVPEQGYVWVD